MELPINQINIKKHLGKNIDVVGTIDRVAQTSGPTLFDLVDGSGVLVLKGFDGPGVRAYPDIKEGDVVRASIEVREFQDALEGEIKRIKKLEGNDVTNVRSKISDLERKRAAITPPDFLVKSVILDKLRERFIKAATEIRLAVIQNRPIIVRHHNDTDGYSAGFAVERGILPLIIKQHGGGKAPWEYYTRSPCAAPMYEIDDSIRDTAFSLSDMAKFSNKMPLVVIVDTGSGEEDLLGIKQGRIHGIDFIVVDHHYFEKDVISDECKVHINPFLVEEDGSKFSAGMLCTELARFINPTVVLDYLPAMSGFADRIDNPEVMSAYLKIAEKKGYTKSLLSDISAVIDFVSAKIRFMEAREFIEVVFGEPIERQKALVSLLVPHIKKLGIRGLSIGESNAKTEIIGKTTLQTLMIEEVYPRGSYPKPGICINMLHDKIQKSGEITNVITLGILTDAITIRASQESGFSIHDLISYLNKNVPAAFIEGGGHHRAGSIKFVPIERINVLSAIKKFISSR